MGYPSLSVPRFDRGDDRHPPERGVITAPTGPRSTRAVCTAKRRQTQNFQDAEAFIYNATERSRSRSSHRYLSHTSELVSSENGMTEGGLFNVRLFDAEVISENHRSSRGDRWCPLDPRDYVAMRSGVMTTSGLNTFITAGGQRGPQRTSCCGTYINPCCLRSSSNGKGDQPGEVP